MADVDGPDVVTVVGIGADGWSGLTAVARGRLAAAEVVFGGPRQLGMLPDDVGGLRVSWPSPLVPALPAILAEHTGRRVCALASGDPMFFGLGGTLVRLLGAGRVDVLPHPSSVSLACARLGWPLEDTEVVSVVGRPLATVHPVITPGRRLIVLSADRRSPAEIAGLLTRRGYGDSPLTVLEHLGGPDERRRTAPARHWTRAGAGDQGDGDARDVRDIADIADIADLNLVAVELRAEPDAPRLPRTPGLPDDVFDHDGQLTKREVRAVTLARLAPAPGELLWDVGAGCGSVAIEWMRTHPACRAVAVEPRPDRVERIRRNAENLGVPTLRTVCGAAPAALAGLAGGRGDGDVGETGRPAAVFVGGGLTVPGVVESCWEALAPGGRLVANAVTVESEAVLADWHARLGGDLVRLAVSRAGPVGGFTGWRPMLPVTQWAVTKPPEKPPEKPFEKPSAKPSDTTR